MYKSNGALNNIIPSLLHCLTHSTYGQCSAPTHSFDPLEVLVRPLQSRDQPNVPTRIIRTHPHIRYSGAQFPKMDHYTSSLWAFLPGFRRCTTGQGSTTTSLTHQKRDSHGPNGHAPHNGPRPPPLPNQSFVLCSQIHLVLHHCTPCPRPCISSPSPLAPI